MPRAADSVHRPLPHRKHWRNSSATTCTHRRTARRGIGGKTLETGHLTWVLTSAALVLFMTHVLALFYGGMDRSRNVLNMLMMNFYCLLIVPLLWMAIGYSLAQVPFSNKYIGTFDSFFLKDITEVGDGSTLAII